MDKILSIHRDYGAVHVTYLRDGEALKRIDFSLDMAEATRFAEALMFLVGRASSSVEIVLAPAVPH